MTDTWIDKADWGPGPWQDEPDRAEWYDGDLPCLALRHSVGGHWCGYVAVPPGHPWHADSDPDVSVHGGVTFTERCAPPSDARDKREQVCHVPRPGEPDDVWWIGFDFAHGSDYAPGRAARMWGAEIEIQGWEPDRGDYKSLPYVRAECSAVAEQVRMAA